MTTTALDVEAIEHLDFAPVCTNEKCKDDHPTATHFGRVTCGCLLLFCTGCARRVAKSAEEICLWYCDICNVTLGYGCGLRFIRIEPLP